MERCWRGAREAGGVAVVGGVVRTCERPIHYSHGAVKASAMLAARVIVIRSKNGMLGGGWRSTTKSCLGLSARPLWPFTTARLHGTRFLGPVHRFWCVVERAPCRACPNCPGRSSGPGVLNAHGLRLRRGPDRVVAPQTKLNGRLSDEYVGGPGARGGGLNSWRARGPGPGEGLNSWRGRFI